MVKRLRQVSFTGHKYRSLFQRHITTGGLAYTRPELAFNWGLGLGDTV